MRVIYLREEEIEILETIAFYEDNSVGLGADFLDRLLRGCLKKLLRQASSLAGSALVHPECIPREAWMPHGAVLDLMIQPRAVLKLLRQPPPDP